MKESGYVSPGIHGGKQILVQQVCCPFICQDGEHLLRGRQVESLKRAGRDGDYSVSSMP